MSVDISRDEYFEDAYYDRLRYKSGMCVSFTKKECVLFGHKYINSMNIIELPFAVRGILRCNKIIATKCLILAKFDGLDYTSLIDTSVAPNKLFKVYLGKYDGERYTYFISESIKLLFNTGENLRFETVKENTIKEAPSHDNLYSIDSLNEWFMWCQRDTNLEQRREWITFLAAVKCTSNIEKNKIYKFVKILKYHKYWKMHISSYL